MRHTATTTNEKNSNSLNVRDENHSHYCFSQISFTQMLNTKISKTNLSSQRMIYHKIRKKIFLLHKKTKATTIKLITKNSTFLNKYRHLAQYHDV